MLQFFRNFFKSKFGVGITMGLLVLIALAFASADVSNSGKFGSVTGGDRVAMVGSDRISTSQLSKAATNAFENSKQENPQLSMKAFVAADGLAKVLDQLIDNTAMGVFGRKVGMVAGDRLIDSEIAKIPAFQGPDGKFSDAAYRQLLQQRGLSNDTIREDFAQRLVARQLLVPAAFGAQAPQEVVNRYAALLREHRTGGIALLPSAAFVTRVPPSDGEITAYYASHRDHYIRPERRVIRYALFDDTALKNVAAPSEAEIGAKYKSDQALYAASEMRTITQLILPTEPAAKAVLAELAKGTSLEASASAKGLSAATLPPVSKRALTEQSSALVADATFGAPRGKIAGPVRGALGWYLMRVDAIEAKSARSLDQVRNEISTALAQAKRRAALVDFSAKLEDEFDKGGSLADVAKELGLTPVLTPPMTSDGQLYGAVGKAPPELARVTSAAFAMERENQPQLAEIEAGRKFMVFDVTAITSSAPAPLGQIKGDVAFDIALEKGAAAAKTAIDKVLAAVRKGDDLSSAMAALGPQAGGNLPPVDQVDMGREQLAAKGQQVPAPLALLFNMAAGSVKSLQAPKNRGWYVVVLKSIVPGAIAANDPLLSKARQELSTFAGREYAEQLRHAIRAQVGVERNENAIRAVGTQLTGGN